MKIIAFGHTKGIGKDTAAKFLATIIKTQSGNKNNNVVQVNFASKIKSIAYDIYKHKGLQDEQYYEEHPEQKNQILPNLGKSPREIWIHVGNTLRLIDDEVWIDYPMNKISCDVLLFRDLRFPTEANKIIAKGGICVKITNNRVSHTSDVADDALLNFDQWHSTIENNGTLNELHNKMEIFAKELKLI